MPAKRTRPEPPLPKTIAAFVKHQLADKYAFAAFTGTDFPAWQAFLYGVQLYGRGNQHKAIDIMRACVAAAQQKADVLAVFQKSIPGVLDWNYETSLWPQIAPIAKDGSPRFFAPLGERVCAHIRSKPSTTYPGRFVCKDCKAEWSLGS